MRSQILSGLVGAAVAIGAMTVLRSPGRLEPLAPSAVAPTAIELALDRPLPEVWLEDVPFDEAVRRVAGLAGTAVAVDWYELQIVGFNPATRINVRARNIPLSAVLSEIVAGPVTRQLGYRTDTGVILITSAAAATRDVQVRCYDVRPHLKPPPYPWMEHEAPTYSLFATSPAPISDAAHRADNLRSLLMDSVAPDSWRENGGTLGVARIVGERLVVVQTRENHRALRRVLAEIAERNASPSPPEATAVIERWNGTLRRFVAEWPDRALSNLERSVPELSIESATLEGAIDVLRRTWEADIVFEPPKPASNFDARARVTLHRRHVTLASALQTILGDASWRAPMGYGIEQGVIVVADQHRADAMASTHAYEVRDLFAASLAADPSLDRWAVSESLIGAIVQSVAPDSWRTTGGSVGAIAEVGAQLVITQSAENHAAVARLLSDMRRGVGPKWPATRPATAPTTERGSP